MDIQHLKGLADDDEAFNQAVEEAQKEAMLKLKKLESIGRDCGKKWDDKIRQETRKFLTGFYKYFTDEGFSVEERTPEIIEAVYKSLTIVLNDLNYDGEYMCLRNIAGSSVEFKFDSDPAKPNYRVYKRNLAVGSIRQVDFINHLEEGAAIASEAFIEHISTVEDIDKLNSLIDENILHFNEGLKVIDDIDICIIVHGSDTTYKNFGEFIAAIDLN